MKTPQKVSLGVLTLLIIAAPIFAQEQRPPVSSETGGRGGLSTGSSPSVGGGSITSRGIAVGDSSGGSVSSVSRDTGPSFSSAGVVNTAHAVPNLQGTSFYSVTSYYEWQDFLWRLRTRYMLDSMYFRRFYRNQEPLVTPHLLKLALREPLSLSSRMVLAVEDLENMVSDLQAGKPVNKKDLASKANQIREYAKKIRSDDSLAFVDRRTDTDIAKQQNFKNLGLDAITQLRELVNDLHIQLKGMYSQTGTSTVSVHTLSQPSFESMSRGIEKLSKIIESSARKL